ncbi:hypothetical protein UFOVP257_63 [uncultured Caudovirales phage]|uniref:Uncharacterized protein n=1 Tax=uncultured Caudovirales phage TaxID=2100421 RepID=A0A6J5LJL6_9CAUD|nr:hypothetical protein UFOVP257_63 [uncultured Caudovirales phage]
MTELYRGLLLVLTNKFNELILAFRNHIQLFNSETEDNDSYFDVGVIGFWNLMLEIALTLFALSGLVVGVSLVASLAIVFYPLHAIISYSSLLLKNTRNPQQDHFLFKEKIPPIIDEQPTIIKKDGKEKE